jgi:hypothetical protein
MDLLSEGCRRACGYEDRYFCPQVAATIKFTRIIARAIGVE